MAMAPFGPKVPQKVKDAVNRVKADLGAGNIVAFKGPIKDQDGNIRVAEGAVLKEDVMGSVDWFVEGVIGKPK
jgi:basic membrane protein A